MSAQVEVQDSLELLKSKIKIYEKMFSDINDLLSNADAWPDGDFRKNIDQIKQLVGWVEVRNPALC